MESTFGSAGSPGSGSPSRSRTRFNRRDLLKAAGAAGLVVPVGSLLAACGGDSGEPPATTAPGGSDGPSTGDSTPTAPAGTGGGDGPTRGGTLRVAMDVVPPSVDAQRSTAYHTRVIMGSVTEGLFTLNDEYDIIPELAEGFELSADELTCHIPIREGLVFHDGSDVTVEDITASLERWLTISTPGKAYTPLIESLSASGERAIEFRFKEPIAHLLIAALAFSYQAASIHPKRQIDEVGTDGTMDQPIGTGPFKLASVDLDREVVLERFDGYVARDEPSNGYGGRKEAYLDSVRVIPTPEAAVRASGLEAGDFDFVMNLSRDDYARLEGNPDLQLILQFQGSRDIALNNKEGPFTDKRLRKAFQAALSVEELLVANYSDPRFFRVDNGLWPKETVWWTDAGSHEYNQNNPDKARQLLQEAGYDGTPIRWLATEDEKLPVVAKQQLENAGFVVQLDIVDWATLLSRRNDPSVWEVFTTGFSIQPEPTQYLVFDCTWPAFWCDEKKNELVDRLKAETDFTKRKAIWEELQAYYWEEAPVYKVGDYFNLLGASAEVQGYANMNQMFWYNVWLGK